MADPADYERAYSADLSTAHGELDRYLRQDGASVFMQPAWNDSPQVSGSTVNALLDAGMAGHEWFTRMIVRAHRAAHIFPGLDKITIPAVQVNGAVAVNETSIDILADPATTTRRLQAMYYDLQRGTDLDSMRALAAKLKAASDGSADMLADLEHVATALPEVWQGASATAAFDHLTGLHTHTAHRTQYLHQVGEALNTATDVIEHVVRDKATFFAGFNTSQMPIAGHAMRVSATDPGGNDPVSIILTVASERRNGITIFGHSALIKDERAAANQLHIPDPTDDEEWMLQYAVHLPDFGSFPHSAAGVAVINACENWIVNHLFPAARAALEAYVKICGLGDFYIKQAYKDVLNLLKTPGPDAGAPGAQPPFGGPPAHAPAPNPPHPRDNSPRLPPSPGTQSTDTTPAATAPTAPAAHTGPAAPTPPPGNTPNTSPATGLVSGASNALDSAAGHLADLAEKALNSSSTHGRSSDTPHDTHSDTHNPDSSGPSHPAPPPSDHHEPHPAAGSPPPPATPPPAPPPAPPLVDVDIPGGHITARRNPDGHIVVTFFDPAGHGQQYTLGINQNGLPFITPPQSPPVALPPAPPGAVHPPPAHPASTTHDSNPHSGLTPPPMPESPPPAHPIPHDITAPSANSDTTPLIPTHRPSDDATAAVPLIAGTTAALGKNITSGDQERIKPRPYHRRIPDPPPPDTSLIAPTEEITVTQRADTPSPLHSPLPNRTQSHRKTATETEAWP